jgi:hypothetical protein
MWCPWLNFPPDLVTHADYRPYCSLSLDVSHSRPNRIYPVMDFLCYQWSIAFGSLSLSENPPFSASVWQNHFIGIFLQEMRLVRMLPHSTFDILHSLSFILRSSQFYPELNFHKLHPQFLET